MCSKCFDELEHLSIDVSRKCMGKDVYCAGIYSKNLQKMIRGLKYHGQRELAYYQAKFMWQYWERLGLDGDYTLVPVPIFPKRRKKRKYNHMELVAIEFSKLSGFKINSELVKRVKDTKAQYNLNKAQRMLNLSNAFEVYPEKYKGEKLLLIDDICTTGSTFEEMIRVLKDCGIDDITCFATTTPWG
jgi:ComF family protein